MDIAKIKLEHNLKIKINRKTRPYRIEGLIHEFWKPTKRVLEFWHTGCIIEYRGEEDYLEQKELINKSLQESINKA